ncbi:VanW family protein [Streptomyces sp. NBC_00690]|uniref:VanW family protein n=1 Tax=Streptomyces sp. NBC_00690 TaxID=2975808 RepID=UPI002E283E5C|nr:VanW family protein [Streptomyces sp. NBC_00690]
MRRRIHPAAATGGALAVGVGALYLSGLFLTADEIPEGTAVRGVNIGGMSQSQAREVLDRELGDGATTPLAVKIGTRTDSLDPRTAGFRFDAGETVDKAVRPGNDPISVIGSLFSSDGSTIEPVVHLDEDKARAALGELAREHDRKARDGAITFAAGEPRQTRPLDGQRLNLDASVDALRPSFLAAQPRPVDLPVHKTAPRIGAAETNRALREFAEPAMSAPITLTAGGERITISPKVLGKHLDMSPDSKGRLLPKLDGKGLYKDPAVASEISDATNEATDAKIRLNGEQVEIVADGKPGQEVTAASLKNTVMPLLTKSGTARTGEVVTKKSQPKLTRESIAAMGVTEKLSSFTATFEKAEYRTKNIGRAAELINGSLVKPQETWSFNRTVGERTKENGFVDGIIILNDKYTKAAGGGVSTVATAVFNAIFFSGVKPVEYGAHSFYIERYPEGREATVAWGSLDLKFANDSGNSIYIMAESTDTSVTVTFLGTKKYDSVEASKGPRKNVQEPGTRPGAKKDCQPQTPLEGFDVTVERIFRNNGEEVKREPFHTRYTPRDKVTCET